MKRSIQLATLTALITSIPYAGFSMASASENDAYQILAAKIGLKQAITIVEKKYAGKASKAEYDQEHGKVIFEVEVVSDKAVHDVLVDGNTGRIVRAVVDKPDISDENDEDR